MQTQCSPSEGQAQALPPNSPGQSELYNIMSGSSGNAQQQQQQYAVGSSGASSGASNTAPQSTGGQQQGSNYNSSSSFPSSNRRRVTIGGSSFGGGQERRGSMASNLAMDPMGDLFGRRPSMGFDVDMLTRRDSLDSTTAVLDAAILDLTRRRLSMAVGGGSQSGIGAEYGMAGGGSVPPSTGSNMMPPTSTAVTSIAARQQQLQQQQRELEQRQKDLEIQRQQLLAGMQNRELMSHPHAQAHHHPHAHAHAHSQMHQDPSMMMGGGLPGPSAPPQQGSNPRTQWWVCQVCNKKAFASLEEAMSHEATCTETPRQDLMATPADINFRRYSGAAQELPDPQSRAMMAAQQSGVQPTLSSGPFESMERPIPLAMESDKDWLTPLHCFVRRNCVQVFTATQKDVATPSKGKRKPIQVGQVGIRCPHCHSDDGTTKAHERGSVYYPTSISSIYNATMNLLQRHLHNCSAVPEEIMRRYETLKADDARSGTSKRYWMESALSLGLVDTEQGIRYSGLNRPPLPGLSRQQHAAGDATTRRNSNEFYSAESNAMKDISQRSESSAEGVTSVARGEGDGNIPDTERSLTDSAPLVTPDDQPYSTAFSYHLLSQMQPCVFTEADRLGKRKGLPPGFPGLACRHCFGGYGSGRFFPSSIKTLSDTSKTLNVLHNHMMRCRKCPPEVRDTLEKLRLTHDEERAKMKFGSQKAFFARIWDRLHNSGGTKRKMPAPMAAPMSAPSPYAPMEQQQQQQQHQQMDQRMDQRMGPHQQHGNTGAPMSAVSNPSMVSAGGLDALANQAVESDPKRRRTA